MDSLEVEREGGDWLLIARDVIIDGPMYSKKKKKNVHVTLSAHVFVCMLVHIFSTIGFRLDGVIGDW